MRLVFSTIIGDLCRVFTMDLNFDALYRMNEIHRLHLPRGASDISTILHIIEDLTHVKVRTNNNQYLFSILKRIIALQRIILETRTQLHDKIAVKQRSKGKNRSKMTRPSFGAPLVSKKKQKTNE